jgi:peptide-methionine (S)-S-oxide reductase
VGYAGGTTPAPTYARIGDHAETVEVEFDPSQITYEQLVELFWEEHDPTRRSFSTQYRNALFWSSPEQERIAQRSRARLEARLGIPVATSLEPAGTFTPAEDYHQKHALRGSPQLMEEFLAMYPGGHGNFATSAAAAKVNGYLGGWGSAAQLAGEIDGFGLSASGRRVLERIAGNLPLDRACPLPARSRGPN